MFAGDTDPVSRQARVLGSLLALLVAGGAAWYVTDLSRDGRTGAGAATPLQAEGAGAAAVTGSPAATPRDADSAAARSLASQLTGPAVPNGAEVTDDTETTLVLAGGETLVSYPADFGLAVTQEQLLVSSQIPPCEQGFNYCVYLDSDEFVGTNFASAGLRIDQRADLASEADCMLTQPSGYADLVPVVAGASDYATTMFAGVGQGAAGHFSQGSLGRLYFDSVCYEFETRIAQARYENFPQGSVEEYDAEDLAKTEVRLLGLLDSVTLPDGRSGLWARKVPAAQPASVTLSRPAAGDAVASPITVVGQAPGPWFFEATLPYELRAADGTVVASGAVHAGDDWMTEGPVPFEAVIEFAVPSTTEAVLVLMKDNPSGLPENDGSFELPLHLLP